MVCLDGEELSFWKMTSKGAKRPDGAAAYAKKMIDRYTPDWVIFEDPQTARCKGEKTKQLIDAMTKVARQSQANCMVVERDKASRTSIKRPTHSSRVTPNSTPSQSNEIGHSILSQGLRSCSKR